MNHHIVRRVQPPALPTVGQDGLLTVVFRAHKPPGQMLAGDEPAFTVNGVAIGILRRLAKYSHGTVEFVQAQHAIVRDVRPDQRAVRGKPGRAFAPARSRPQPLDALAMQQAAGKSGLQHLKAGTLQCSKWFQAMGLLKVGIYQRLPGELAATITAMMMSPVSKVRRPGPAPAALSMATSRNMNMAAPQMPGTLGAPPLTAVPPMTTTAIVSKRYSCPWSSELPPANPAISAPVRPARPAQIT